MSSVEEVIEIYHHDSNRKEDWSYSCPRLYLVGFKDINELVKEIEQVKYGHKVIQNDIQK